MDNKQLIPIERKNGVTLYGRIVAPGGKLGQYEVHSDILGNNGTVFTSIKEAQQRMNALIGFQNN